MLRDASFVSCRLRAGLETSVSRRVTRLKALKGDRAGQYSIRINDQFRVCFRWSAAGAEDVEIVDYH